MLRRVYEFVKDEEFRFTVFNNRIHVVNYKKINTLNSDYILIESDDRRIGIKGNNWALNKMLDREILVIGNVKSIEVIYE